jgi:hypothetical protein
LVVNVVAQFFVVGMGPVTVTSMIFKKYNLFYAAHQSLHIYLCFLHKAKEEEEEEELKA